MRPDRALRRERLDRSFCGVYEVGARSIVDQNLLPPDCPHPEWAKAGNSYYELQKSKGFEDLEDRLIIDWGKAALAWHQWFTDRQVLEIRAQGRALPPFRDYLRVHLSFTELVRLAAQPEAHHDWVSVSQPWAASTSRERLDGEQYGGRAGTVASGNAGASTRGLGMQATSVERVVRQGCRCGPAAFTSRFWRLLSDCRS